MDPIGRGLGRWLPHGNGSPLGWKLTCGGGVVASTAVPVNDAPAAIAADELFPAETVLRCDGAYDIVGLYTEVKDVTEIAL